MFLPDCRKKKTALVIVTVHIRGHLDQVDKPKGLAMGLELLLATWNLVSEGYTAILKHGNVSYNNC